MKSFMDFINIEKNKRGCKQIEIGTKIGINTSAIIRIDTLSKKSSILKLKNWLIKTYYLRQTY